VIRHAKRADHTFFHEPTRKRQDRLWINAESGSLLYEFSYPIRFCAYLCDSTAVLTPRPDKPSTIVGYNVLLKASSAFLLAARFRFDYGNTRGADHHVVDIKVLFSSLCRDIVENAKAVSQERLQILGDSAFANVTKKIIPAAVQESEQENRRAYSTGANHRHRSAK
jgi:hypothetical protein